MNNLISAGNFTETNLNDMVKGYVIDPSCDFTLKGDLGPLYRAKVLSAALCEAMAVWEKLCPDIRPYNIRMCHASAGAGGFAVLIRFAFEDEQGKIKAVVFESQIQEEKISKVTIWHEGQNKKYVLESNNTFQNATNRS